MRTRLTTVETSNTLFSHDTLEAGGHALSALTSRHVGTGLDRDVRVRDARGGQLAEGSEQEAVGCGHLATLLEHLLQLLEDGVLQDRVDDQDECGQHAGEQTSRTVLADDLEEGRQSAWLASLLHFHVADLDGLFGLGLAGGHAGVDDPDRVGDEHGGRAGESTRGHGLEGAEARLLKSAGEVVSAELIPWRRGVSCVMLRAIHDIQHAYSSNRQSW
jgi:hypothetical protein